MDNGKKFWDRFARLYAPIQERSNRALYDRVADLCAPYITEETRVLELACGTGQLTLPLCRLAGYWEATDFSEKMLRELGRRCPDFVALSVEDATDLTYGDGSFQVVLIANALHIMPDPQKALAEIRRVLSPGGLLLAPTFVYEGRINRARMWLTVQLGFPSFYKWRLREFRAVLEQAGFRVVRQELIPGDPLPEAFLAVQKP